ncbi:Tubulin polyglutamylase TTLL5 [Trichinella spiralis]|uniref:Tubulin polyglutamylase TTLL5 n=1 Tax=Trichinella spiralis TaxID=6334 RepID=A0ABR3KQM4_TRISP
MQPTFLDVQLKTSQSSAVMTDVIIKFSISSCACRRLGFVNCNSTCRSRLYILACDYSAYSLRDVHFSLL